MITITDVANHCGVSISTVSRVLNGNPRISRERTEQVLKAVKELGYTPIRKTRKTKRNDEIILVMPNPSLYTLGTTIKDITITLQQVDYDIRIVNLHFERLITKDIASDLCDKNAAGIIIYGCSVPLDAAKVFYERNVPTVVQQGHTSNLVSICVNNYSGMRDSLSYVLSRGYKRVGFVGWEKTDFNIQERVDSFKNMLTSADLEPDMISLRRLNIEGGYDAMKEMMNTYEPEAVVFSADIMAYGGLKYLREQGLRMKDDVGIIGFDDAYLSEVIGLTTMYQLLEENVNLVIENLMAMIEQDTVFEAKEVQLTPRLVVRNSLR